MPPLPPERRAEAIAKFNIKFPQKLLGSGPPEIYATSLNLVANPDGVTTPNDDVMVEYPNGVQIGRTYREPTAIGVRNMREFVEETQKDPYPDGRYWKLVDVSGHQGMAIEKGTNFWDGRPEPSPAVLSLYVEPFLYDMYVPFDISIAEMVSIGSDLTALVTADASLSTSETVSSTTTVSPSGTGNQ